jgi:hypothetical protein
MFVGPQGQQTRLSSKCILHRYGLHNSDMSR